MKEASKAKSQEKNPEIPYSEAVAELETILAEIENGETDIDILSEKVKRALFLIRYCKARLKSTDEELKKMLDEFSDEN